MKYPLLSYGLFGLQIVVVFLGYLLAGNAALALNPLPGFDVFFWPAAGIGLAALYLLGVRMWPAVALAAFSVNYAQGAPLLVALAIAFGNTLEALFGAYVLHKFQFDGLFGKLRESLVFIATILGSALLAAIIGTSALSLAGTIPPTETPLTLLVWWIGDTLGMMFFGAFLIRWLVRPLQTSARTYIDFFEIVVFFFVLSLVVLILFWSELVNVNSSPLLYLTFIPVTWGSLRLGPRVMIAGITLIAAVTISGTILAGGPFFEKTTTDMLLLQAYLGTVGIISLLFVATVEERKESIRIAGLAMASLRKDVQVISESDRAKNDFIATLSHELRNPLSPVLSALEIMRLRPPGTPGVTPEETAELIETSHDNAQRMARLLDDLLDVARISRKKFKLELKNVSLRSLIEHSAKMCEAHIHRYSHTLVVSPPIPDIFLDVDPLRIEQVIVNLLNNAAKYTPEGGTIWLRAEATEGGARITIKDTGLGIPNNMLERIFEPFKQLDRDSSNDRASGLGIGLSLAKRLIEIHGGTILAQSEGIGKGSEFTVQLPVRPPLMLSPGSAPSPEAPTLSIVKKTKRSVLIVDDNEDAARSIATLLNHSGHTARTAQSGSDALAVLSEFSPDIIFLDIGLAGESGYDVARSIRERFSPSPLLVALTGYGQDEDKMRAREAGFDFHLTKPVSIADLEGMLTRVS